MAAFFANLRNTVIAGTILALIIIAIHIGMQNGPIVWESFGLGLLRWAHVVCGVMWIGLLWYFNFVSTPTTPSIPAELRPALGKYITPAALWWFRWGAMGTIVFGLIIAALKGITGYLIPAYTLGASEGFADESHIIIGIGMWFATIMWFNVWFVIWPNQQKALTLNPAYASLSADDKAAAAKTAGMFSRINTMLSIPMLLCMVGATHFFIG
jgi:uncharacterized membrane protein